MAFLFAFRVFFYLRCGFFICVVVSLFALWYFYLSCGFFFVAPVGHRSRREQFRNNFPLISNVRNHTIVRVSNEIVSLKA